MTDSPPGISIERVTKVFDGEVVAVDDVSLEVGDGELMVLVGPSGCGKSTLLRLIAGLEKVTAGRIVIGGRDVTAVAPPDRDIAMVFQNYALYPHMTVRENLAFGLRQRRTPREEVARRVGELASMLGLDPLMARRPAQLSGGQRQRVAIGRALVREPSAFLLDEPLSNLDAKLRTSMRSELARLHERLRTTTVYVTHDQVEAMTLGDRVAVLRDGVVQQCDVPQVLFRRPCNLFVAAFIGSPAMNLVPAHLDGGVARFAEHEIPLPSSFPLRGASARDVILGVRPTAFAFDGPRAEPDWPRIDVAVELVEELGDEVQLTFQVDAPRVEAEAVRAAADTEDADEGRLLLDDRRTRFTASLDGRRAVRPGERVRLALDARDLHFFDPATGEALVQDAVPEAALSRQSDSSVSRAQPSA
jgi:multiple sugar transport system ATP-binding protein